MKKLINWINSKPLEPRPFLLIAMLFTLVYGIASKKVAGEYLRWYEFNGILKLPFGLLTFVYDYFVVLGIAALRQKIERLSTQYRNK